MGFHKPPNWQEYLYLSMYLREYLCSWGASLSYQTWMNKNISILAIVSIEDL